jgi:uncharacterized protein YjbJ (UPF0337 family)
MNKDVVQGKWKEIKGDLRKAWGDVSDDDWEKTKGDATAIAGVVQQRYGLAKEEASEKVSKLMAKYTSSTRDKVDRDLEEREDEDRLN